MKYGDHVTVLRHDGVLVLGRWAAAGQQALVMPTARFRTRSSVQGIPVHAEHEGITWAPGWHDEKDDVGRTLLATHAMAETRPLPPGARPPFTRSGRFL